MIITGSAEDYYSGYALTNSTPESIILNGYYDGLTPLVNDHVLTVLRSTAIINVDEVPNEYLSILITEGAEGRDVTHNYEVTYTCGVLKLLPREITVTTPSADKVYDGIPLECTDIDATAIGGMGMAENQYFKALSSTSIVYASDLDDFGDPIPVDNVFLMYAVYDTNNQAIDAKNYKITFVYGQLIIQKRNVTVEVSAQKTYDSLSISSEDVIWRDLLTPYALLSGHNVLVLIGNDRYEVGEEDLIITSFGIYSEAGKDMTENYQVDLVAKKAVVDKAYICITSSAEKMYDGKPLTCDTPSYEGYLYDTHEIRIVTEGSQTEVGISENVITKAIIVDKLTGNDVSSNYTVDIRNGKLEVKETAFVIRSSSAEKEYDGTPLTNPTFMTEGVPLPEGYRWEVTVTGSQTEIGDSPNHFTYKIFDENGNDVTDKVFVKCVYGLLTVTEEKGTAINGGVSTFRVIMYSQNGGSYYIRDAYYGDYNGLGFDPAVKYFGGVINPMQLTGEALKNEGGETHVVKFRGGKYYMVYNVVDGLGPTSDLPTIQNDGTYTYEVVTGENFHAMLPEELVAFEETYRAHVYENYLQIPDSTKEVLLRLAAEAGLDPSDEDIIYKVCNYIKSSAEYTLDYNYPADCEDMVIAFLTDVRKGVCVHFASAATMMYRALGIPARYVTGGVPSVNAGEWTELDVIAHAWTEVYVDGYGWVAIDATGSGTLPEFPELDHEELPLPQLVITPDEITVTYDGKSHGPTGQEFHITGTPLPEGYTIVDVIFSDPKTEVGNYQSYIKDFKILDADGNNVTNQFNCLLERAVLKIEKCPLVIRTNDAHKYFNGLPLTANTDDDWWVSAGMLPTGYTLDVTIDGTITNPGTVANTVSKIVVYDREGNDVTDSFEIQIVCGFLQVEI